MNKNLQKGGFCSSTQQQVFRPKQAAEEWSARSRRGSYTPSIVIAGREGLREKGEMKH